MAETVKSAERVLAILELLTAAEAPLRFADIGGQLAYPQSSLHGLLRTLAVRGWVDVSPKDRTYTLGIRNLEAGNVYSRCLGLVDRALPYMERIRDEFDETCQLAVLDGVQNVYVAKVDGRQTLTLASEIGRRLPAYATGVGKVLLAGLGGDELARRLNGVELRAITPHTVTDRKELEAQLANIRSLGFGVDDEEYTLGIRCVAVPVCDHTGRTVAAMSVSVPAIRFAPKRREQFHGLLADAAANISAALGYPAKIRDPADSGEPYRWSEGIHDHQPKESLLCRQTNEYSSG